MVSPLPYAETLADLLSDWLGERSVGTCVQLIGIQARCPFGSVLFSVPLGNVCLAWAIALTLLDALQALILEICFGSLRIFVLEILFSLDCYSWILLFGVLGYLLS